MYPNPNSYTIQIPWVVQNLQEIWLSSAAYPAVAGPLVGVLRIAELIPSGLVGGNFNGASAGVLAVVPMAPAGNVFYEPTEPKMIDSQMVSDCAYSLNIANFTISWVDQLGNPLAIGDHFLRFTLICKHS